MNTDRAIAIALGLLSIALGAACEPLGVGPTGVPGIDKFRVQGPERAADAQGMPVGTCTHFLPSSVGPADSRPGLGWANGTGTSPGFYMGILNRVASYGTLVTAANTAASGTGVEVAACIDQLDAARVDSNGRFATAGHSQGGSGALNAARLNAKVVVTCPVQLDGTFTATSNAADLRGTRAGPALILCGGADTLAPCTSPANGDGKFSAATVPVTRISVVGAPHVGTGSPLGPDGPLGPGNGLGDGGLYPALVTTCVEAALGGDAEASAALQPGGAQNNSVINRIESRNF